jgi:hypothetical protein
MRRPRLILEIDVGEGLPAVVAHQREVVGQKKAIAIAVRHVSGGGGGRSWQNGSP